MADLAKEHVWRTYDYPHVVMLYFHMYQIAKMYPELTTYLDAAGYLDRAWDTARAFYTYPYEIYPSYYDTYKWGLYNELVVLDLIDALKAEGYPEQAKWLPGRVGEEDQVFRVRRRVSVPFRVRVRPDGVRVDLRPGEVRRHPRHGARPEPVVRPQVAEVVVAPDREARGLARVHGSAADGRAGRPGLAQSGVLRARRRSRRELHGGDGRVGRARLRAQLRAQSLRLAAAGLRVVSELVVPREQRHRRSGLRLPGSRARRTTAPRAGSS